MEIREFESFVKQLGSAEDFVESKLDEEEIIFFYKFNHQSYGLKFINGKVYILKKLCDDNYHSVAFQNGHFYKECLFFSFDENWIVKPLAFATHVENITSSWKKAI